MYATLTSVQEALKNNDTKCLQLVEKYLSEIEKQKSLNAFVQVYADEARLQAQAIDKNIAAGSARQVINDRPLTGAVIGIKDNLCYKDHPAQAASKILEGYISSYSATAIDRLVKAGAIIIGRQNCDEFGHGLFYRKLCLWPRSQCCRQR